MRHTASPSVNPPEGETPASAPRRSRGLRSALLSALLLLGVGGFTLFALWESLRPPTRPVRAGGLRVISRHDKPEVVLLSLELFEARRIEHKTARGETLGYEGCVFAQQLDIKHESVGKAPKPLFSTIAAARG